jgi:hypothetical protein
VSLIHERWRKHIYGAGCQRRFLLKTMGKAQGEKLFEKNQKKFKKSIDKKGMR